MKFFKKGILLLLALCIVFGCFACKGKESGEEETGQKTFPNLYFRFDYFVPEEKEDGYEKGYVSLSNCDDLYAFEDVEAEVKVRGNSTADADKKPYRIKFYEKRGMLGLNDGAECRNWVLLADAYDYSMSRNYFMFGLGKVFDNTYCTDRTYVNLYINDEYNGVYLLVEQQQVNKNRVAVDETNVEISADTGYFLEIDNGRADGEAKVFDSEVTEENVDLDSDYYFEISYPKSKGSSSLRTRQIVIKSDLSMDRTVKFAQLKKISAYVQKAYDVMFNYEDEYTVRSFIDIPSAVDMFLINAFTTAKVGNLSEFMYVDFTADEPRLHFGAPWDFDLDLNNYGSDNHSVETMQSISGSSNLFYPLSQCDWFMREVRNRWTETNAKEEIGKMVSDLNPLNKNATCNVYAGEFKKNYERWPVWGEKQVSFQSDRSEKFENHHDAMKDVYTWVSGRYDYLCRYFM